MSIGTKDSRDGSKGEGDEYYSGVPVLQEVSRREEDFDYELGYRHDIRPITFYAEKGSLVSTVPDRVLSLGTGRVDRTPDPLPTDRGPAPATSGRNSALAGQLALPRH